jgi:hypothetical protein
MRLRKISVIFLLVLLAPNLLAQTTDISGKYEGTVEVQSLGKLAVTAEIRQQGDKLSGAVQTPLGEAPILDGSIRDGNLLITIDAGGDDVFLSGKVGSDRKLTGEISGAVGKGTFELKRTGNATPEAETKVVLALSKEKWREDLRFLASELPRKHKNAFHRITRAQFEKMVADLDRQIPTLTDEEIVLGMMRIAASIGDGHTGLSWGWLFPRVPMSLFWFGRELRVIAVAKNYPRVNGARLVKIGGVPVEKIYERGREYISQGESEQYVLQASTYLFTFPVILKNLGAAKNSDSAVYEFIDAKGKKFSLELKALPHDAVKDWIVPYKQAPLSLKNHEKPFYFEYLKDVKTVYVNFRWYPRRSEFREFSAELFDFIDKSEVEKLVFDLRQNGGGDFTRGRDFFIKPLKERKKFLERGRLFVIAGRVTYSAGMANTADFRNDLKAIIVGEPTGARPNGYQENRGFTLPNSHLPVSYSIELYKFSATDTPGILPDKRIEPDWKSFAAGRDPALEWILAYPKTQ